jgi:hypothetical protein
MAAFGQTTRSIHLGLLLTNGASTFLLYRLGRSLAGPAAGLVASAIFALLSLSWAVQGFSANAEHFVLLPVLAGLILVLRATQREHGGQQASARLRTESVDLLAGGFLLGTGLLIKQHAVVFVLMAACYLALEAARDGRKEWKNAAGSMLLLAAGVFLPYLITCLLLLWAGTFTTFWRWTTQYASAYIDPSALGSAIRLLSFRLDRLHQVAPALWWMSLIGLLSLWWNRALGGRRAFVALLVFFSCLGTVPGLHFRAHYFILILPAAALLGGAAVAFPVRALEERGLGRALAFLAAALLLASVIGQRECLFEMTPAQVNRTVYPGNPFAEAEGIGAFLRANSEPDATIAVLGSGPEIFFHARRRSATGHIYMYPLMEDQPYALQMQREMAREIETSDPEYIVDIGIPISWMRRPRSETMIFEWMQAGLFRRYELVGVTEFNDDVSRHYFAPDPLPAKLGPRHLISILRRRDLRPRSGPPAESLPPESSTRSGIQE